MILNISPKVLTTQPCKSHKQTMAYMQWVAFADDMEAKGIKQKQCKKCGRWYYPKHKHT